VLEHVARIQSVLSGLQPHDAPTPISSASPKPLPLSTIHLPIDVDITDRSLGKKIAEARVKKYNHIIVVGSKEVEAGGMNMQIANQPNEEQTVEMLESVISRKLTDREKSRGANVDLESARKYFENLANAYM